MTPINQHWEKDNGSPDGGVSTGIGFTISWQRGPLTEGRNGAFLLEVLGAVRAQLINFQRGKFACPENDTALKHLEIAIEALESRKAKRVADGTLGTHKP